MKIVSTVELADGTIEATFDNGQKAQYRKEDLAAEPVNPEHFQSEVRKMADDASKATEKRSKKSES